METLTNAVEYVKENLWVSLGVFLAIAAVGYFVYRKYFATKVSGFTDLGQGCDPQIENACGENATCQPDETGTKGVCFPKPEEELVQQVEQQVEEQQEEQE